MDRLALPNSTNTQEGDYLDFLYDLSPEVKVVITTRERILFHPIRLEQLPEAEGLDLIAYEAREKNIALSDNDARVLYRRTGGVPAAIVYTVGQLAAGYSVAFVLKKVADAKSDVARFCFEMAVEQLRGQPAHSLLMATAIFPKRPLPMAVAYVAGQSDPIAVEEGLAQLHCLSLVERSDDGRYNMLPLTREYALAELAVHSGFEHQARERWVNWYVSFANEHGGADWRWKEWHIAYDRLEEEWENFLAVFEWCAAHDRYEDIKAFWDFWQEGGVSEFANTYGHWVDRLYWLDWLFRAAEQRGDWSTAAQSLSEKGWTRVVMGQPLEEVQTDLLQAQELCQMRGDADPKALLRVANLAATLCMYQRRYTEAVHWLDESETLLTKTQVDGDEHTRAYDIRKRVGITYRRGTILYETQCYDQAEALFREVIAQCEAIGWQRIAIHSQKWLADCGIAQGNLDEAEHLLKDGLPVAERNRDRRFAALYKRSLAYLEHKRGNQAASWRWAAQARDGFDNLEMYLEAEEMSQLLAERGDQDTSNE